MRIDETASSLTPEWTQAAMPWLAKASLSSITSKSIFSVPGRLHQLERCRHGADAPDAVAARRPRPGEISRRGFGMFFAPPLRKKGS